LRGLPGDRTTGLPGTNESKTTKTQKPHPKKEGESTVQSHEEPGKGYSKDAIKRGGAQKRQRIRRKKGGVAVNEKGKKGKTAPSNHRAEAGTK